MRLCATLQAAFTLFALTTAHPGVNEERSIHEQRIKRSIRTDVRRGLDACTDKLERSGFYARAVERRRNMFSKYRKRAVLDARDVDDVLNTSHYSCESYTLDTPETTIFTDNGTCVLSPEVTIGPYWVKGEQIRKNVRETQEGVEVNLEVQFVNVETCEPVEGLYMEIWNCNSTGVYSGVVSSGNGNTDDATNANNTFLRGLQQSDSDGVVTFETLFPGHYLGRATHHHVIAFANATVNGNNTLDVDAGSVQHIGQLFYDQDLITSVEETSPYNQNTQNLTLNADDSILAQEAENDGSDPMVNYVLLGDSVADGLLGWVTVAINMSADYSSQLAYSWELTASGGVASSGTGLGGGAGGPNGTMPSGIPSGMPSGAPPSGFSMLPASSSVAA